jgi:hypothetical protein
MPLSWASQASSFWRMVRLKILPFRRTAWRTIGSAPRAFIEGEFLVAGEPFTKARGMVVLVAALVILVLVLAVLAVT